jgi:hypothetical protein
MCTCTTRPVKLLGVHISDKPSMRKSVSMGNITQLTERSGNRMEEGYSSNEEHEQK